MIIEIDPSIAIKIFKDIFKITMWWNRDVITDKRCVYCGGNIKYEIPDDFKYCVSCGKKYDVYLPDDNFMYLERIKDILIENGFDIEKIIEKIKNQ